jgi:hypothetical protein
MSDNVQGAIDALLERAATDPALRDRLLADPRGTITAETGMSVPADWDLVARESDGTVTLGFANDQLPEDYLELVAGGNLGMDPNSICA